MWSCHREKIHMLFGNMWFSSHIANDGVLYVILNAGNV